MEMSVDTSVAMNRATTTPASVTTSMTSSIAAMNMSMTDSTCKISMLWNWYTIDSCFIARSWHITSRGMFFAACIGVILLVITVEAIRRSQREYDRYILSTFFQSQQLSSNKKSIPTTNNSDIRVPAQASTSEHSFLLDGSTTHKLRPSALQQATRAGMYMFQFAGAYFIMLLAMTYNGYVIFSILVGAYLGYFLFGWDTVVAVEKKQDQGGTACC